MPETGIPRLVVIVGQCGLRFVVKKVLFSCSWCGKGAKRASCESIGDALASRVPQGYYTGMPSLHSQSTEYCSR